MILIISNIIGGLGNQMFQYAAGRALAYEKNLKFRIDDSDYQNYNLHNFELIKVFNLPVKLAEKADLSAILGWRSSKNVMRLLKNQNLSWLRGAHYIAEPHFNYWSDIVHVPISCYLLGYWQSEKYYKKIESQIRHDFKFKDNFSNFNNFLIEKIKSTNSISLHIRRGDYISNSVANSNHGVLPIDYYINSIEYITQRVTKPKFFIFSDDIDWVKSNLPIKFPFEYVEHNRGSQSFNDMRLISQCRHHIIANSTFSWWGAWLNPDPRKIVVAPRRWFANDRNIQDLFPQSWVVL